MTAKQFLNRARRIDREISQLLELKQHTRDRLTNITQTLTVDIVSGTHDPHRFDKLAELESDINTKIDELVEVKREIFLTLMRVQTRNVRLAMIGYYLDMKTWEQIAVDMNYSYENIMKLRRRGLIEVELLINSQTEKST